MRVLITGGAGFIGSYTAELLLRKGYEVRILDSLESPVHPQKQKPEYIPDDVEFILGDVRNKSDMERALQGVEAVFHLAAYQDYLTDFSRFAFVNGGGTALLYEIMVNKQLPIQKVILGSSQAVYGEGGYECLAHGILDPPPRPLQQLMKGEWDIKCPFCGSKMAPLPTGEAAVNPHNQYGVSKYSQELYALTLGRKYDIPTVILRYSITQGPRQSFYNAYSGILRIFTTRLMSGLPPTIYEDGMQLRDYVHVKDVAEANLLALESDGANFEAFNVGGNKAITVAEYAKLLIDLLGRDIQPEVPGEFRFGDARHNISDSSKLGGLGWEPKASLERIAREYIAWVETCPQISDYYTSASAAMKKMGVIRVVG